MTNGGLLNEFPFSYKRAVAGTTYMLPQPVRLYVHSRHVEPPAGLGRRHSNASRWQFQVGMRMRFNPTSLHESRAPPPKAVGLVESPGRPVDGFDSRLTRSDIPQVLLCLS